MKNILTFLLILVVVPAWAQSEAVLPPYQRFPTLPPVQLLLSDSVTMFSKAQIPPQTPVLYILFDPACSHCQQGITELVLNKAQMDHIQVVMITMPRVSFADVNTFIETYKVRELKHVVVGRDITYFMPSFYSIRNFPFLALYDQNGQLITAMEGNADMSKVIAHFKK